MLDTESQSLSKGDTPAIADRASLVRNDEKTLVPQYLSALVPFKKAAFTLAEVLITLGIIGVVAAMTIPVLISKYQVLQWETALKESYSILTNGFKQLAYLEGCPDLECTGIFVPKEGGGQNSEDTTFNEKMDVAAKRTFKVVKTNKAWEVQPTTHKYLKGGIEVTHAAQYEMYLANGAIVWIQNFGCFDMTHRGGQANKMCGWISVDINGKKGPNIMGKDFFGLGRLYADGTIVPNTSLDYAEAIVGKENAANYSSYWRNYPGACGKPDVKLKDDTTSEILGQDCFARVLENNFELDYLK